MPQVSADSHVPVSPEVARAVAESLPMSPLRIPPHVNTVRERWRFRPEGDGTLAIHSITYAAGPGWLATVAHEPTQWVLRRQAASRVARLADATRAQLGSGAV